MDAAWLKQARAFLEASNHRWNIWVLEYSRGKQLELLTQLGWNAPDWMSLIRLCAILLAAMSGLGVVWLWWTRPRVKTTHWHRQLNRIHRKFTQLGLQPPSSNPIPAPAMVWVAHLKNQSWNQIDANWIQGICQHLTTLDALRYGPDTEQSQIKRRSQQEVAEIEQLCRKWLESRRARQVRAN